MRDRIITGILFIVMMLNSIDVFVDIGLNVPTWHIVQEISLVVISAIGAALLVFHIRRESKNLKHLASDLFDAKNQINTLNSKINDERKRYSLVIKSQFDEWNLTKGEQQVAEFRWRNQCG